MKSKRALAVFAAAALAGVLPSCGGGGGGSSTPTTPSGPSQARITVSVSQATVGFSPLAAYNFRIKVPFQVSESAGLSANLNFIRLLFLSSGVVLERQEIGSSTIISQAGTNRLGANTSPTLNTTFDFNEGRTTEIRFEMGFTDDRGNNLQASGNVPYTVVPAIIN